MNTDKNLLQVQHLSKRFTGNRRQVTAVDDISFSVPSGSCFGLVGESGCGKSTVVSLIAGFYRPDSGKIIYDGSVLPEQGKAARLLRSGMQMIFQNPAGSLNPYMDVEQNLYEAVRYRGDRDRSAWREKALLQLERMGLGDSFLCRHVGELSGGECQRVAIARALMAKPKLLLCDEITSALDVSIQAEIMRCVLELKAEGLTMLFITHDLLLASRICDRIAVMKEGRIVEEDETSAIMTGGHEPYTRLLVEACGW